MKICVIDDHDVVLAELRLPDMTSAAGFVSNSSSLDELRRTLLEVARSRGETAGNHAQGGNPRAAEYLPEHTERRSAGAERGLTPHQQRVLGLAAQGLTYCEISAVLHISESTVRFHIQRIKARLGVRNRSELVAVAIRGGLAATDPYAAIA